MRACFCASFVDIRACGIKTPGEILPTGSRVVATSESFFFCNRNARIILQFSQQMTGDKKFHTRIVFEKENECLGTTSPAVREQNAECTEASMPHTLHLLADGEIYPLKS